MIRMLCLSCVAKPPAARNGVAGSRHVVLASSAVSTPISPGASSAAGVSSSYASSCIITTDRRLKQSQRSCWSSGPDLSVRDFSRLIKVSGGGGSKSSDEDGEWQGATSSKDGVGKEMAVTQNNLADSFVDPATLVDEDVDEYAQERLLRRFLFQEKVDTLEAEQKTDDPLYKVSYATTTEEIFCILKGCEMNSEIAAQAIISLRDLHRMARSSPYHNVDDSAFLGMKYNAALHENPEFQRLLEQLILFLPDLCDEEKAILFQSLRLLDCKLSDPIMVAITIAMKRAEGKLSIRALSYYSAGLRAGNFDVSSIRFRNLRYAITLAPHIPTIRRQIESLETLDQVKSLAIAMKAVASLTNEDLHMAFAAKMQAMINAGVFDKANLADNKVAEKKAISALIRVLDFYNVAFEAAHGMSQSPYTVLCRSVIAQLESRVGQVRPFGMVILSLSLRKVGGPRSIWDAVDERIAKMLDYALSGCELSSSPAGANQRGDPDLEDSEDKVYRSNLPTLSFIAYFNRWKRRGSDIKKYAPIVESAIKGPFFRQHADLIYSILKRSWDSSGATATAKRESRDEKNRIVGMFFNRAVTELDGNWIEMTRLSQQYFALRGSIVGKPTRPCLEFEERMAEMSARDIMQAPFLSVFATQLRFILRTSSGVEAVTPALMQKLRDMMFEADPLSIFMLSGVVADYFTFTSTIANKSRSNNSSSSSSSITSTSQLAQFVGEINAMLEARTEELLSDTCDTSANLWELKTLLESAVLRRKIVDDRLISALADKVTAHLFSDEADSHSSLVAFVCENLRILCIKAPVSTDICDKVVDWTLARSSEVPFRDALIILRFLTNESYDLTGHPRAPAFLKMCQKLVIHNVESDVYTLTSVTAATLLACHRSLSGEVIEKIFCPKFLDGFDADIKELSGSEDRKLRWLWSLMELNRTVCILHPESRVPWFHEKFCQEYWPWHLRRFQSVGGQQHSTSSSSSNYADCGGGGLAEDVYTVLSQVLGGGKYLKDSTRTQYYHPINFEFWMHRKTGQFYPLAEIVGTGSDGGLLSASKLDPNGDYKKFAVLLPAPWEPKGDVRRIGLLQMHELETLGYDVIPINDKVWYHMSMSTLKDKKQYIASLVN